MDLLPIGTLVEVAERLDPPRPYFIAAITGFDEVRGKYTLALRFLRGSQWNFHHGAYWASPAEVTDLGDDVPTVAGICDTCEVPIILRPEGNWEHTGSPDDVRPAQRRRAKREHLKLHLVQPSPCTVELASVWDCDTAADRGYPATNIPLTA